MPERYEAGVAFVATDEGASATIDKMGTHIDRTTDKMRQVIKQTGYLQLALKRIAIYTAIFTFFGALTKLIGEAISLQTRLAEVSTLVDMRNKKMAASFREVTRDLMALSPYLGLATDLTKGLYEIMSAGVTQPAEAFKLLVVSAKYAKAGITDLATAASSLTAIMKAYGYTADEMRAKSDMLFASVMEGKYHAEELNQAIGKVLPTSAAMGVHIDEISAALAVMTQRGLDVNEAATALNRMMLAFMRPIDKAKKEFQKLGWAWGRNAFEGIGLLGVLRRLVEASARYGDILPKIFRRQRALRGAFILAGKGFKDYVKLLQKIRDATEDGGEVARAYGKMIMTVGEEVKAAGARMLKVMYELWQGKGFEWLGIFIKGASSFIAVILKSSRVTLAAVPIIYGLAKAYKRANITLGIWRTNMAAHYATTGRMTKALYAQGIAFQTVTKRARALAGALMAVKVGVIAGIIVYAAGKALLDLWITSSDKAIAKILQETKARKALRDELNMYIAAARQSGELMVEVHGKIEALARAGVLRALQLTTRSRRKDQEEFHRIMKALGEQFGENAVKAGQMWTDVRKLQKALKEGAHVGSEFNYIIQALARSWGYTTKEIKKYIAAQETSLGTMEVYIESMKFLNRLQRDWNKIVDSSSQHVRGLARVLSKEELEDSIKLLGELMELEPESAKWLMAKAYLESLGLSLENLTKKTLPEYMARLKETLAIQPEVFGEMKYEEYMREFKAIIEKLHPPLSDLERMMVAVADSWKEWRKDFGDTAAEGAKAAKEFVANWRQPLILLRSRWEHLSDTEYKVLVERFVMMLDKRISAQEKASKKAVSLHERMINDFIGIDSTMEQMRNELRGEEFNDVLAQTKRLVALQQKKLDKLVAMEIKAGGDLLLISVEYFQKKKVLSDILELGGHVARRRELEDVIKTNMQMLQGSFDFAQQRLIMARQMYQELKDLVRSWYQAGSEQYNNMMKLVEKFYKKTVAVIEKSTPALQHWVDILSYSSRMLSSVVRALNDFAGHLGITEGFVRRFIDVLDVLAKQGQAVASALKLMMKKKELKDIADAATVTAQLAAQRAVLAVVTFHASGATASLAAVEAAYTAQTTAATAATLAFAAALTALVSKILIVFAAIGFLVSIFKLIFGKKKADEVDEVAEAITRGRKALQWFGRVSEDVAKSFDDLRRKFGTWWATVMIIPDLLDEIAQKPRAIGNAFESLISFAEEFGLEGSAAFARLIQKTRDLGIHIKELDEYCQKWLKGSVEGLEDMIWGARGLGDELERLSKIALATFDAMLASGMSFMEALKAMEPALLALYFGMGDLESAGAKAIKRLLDISLIARLNWDLFASIEALTYSYKALAIAGAFYGEQGQELFTALAGQAQEYYDQLRALGLTEFEALQVMAPTLEYMKWLQEEYGLVLDENTQKWLDLAEEYGLIGDKAQTFNEILIAGFDKIIEKLEELIILLSGARKEIDRIPRNAPWDEWEDLDSRMPRGGRRRGGGGKGDGGAQFGIPNLGQNALIYAHRGESILPEALSDALRQFFGGGLQPSLVGGGGGNLTAVITIDGRQFYKAVVPYMKEGAKHGDFEFSSDEVY